MRFKIVIAAYDCMKWLPSCFVSVLSQTDTEYDVCVVDDASPDEDQPAFVKAWCEKRGWDYILHSKNEGALKSQLDAIDLLAPEDEDVIVFVDGDDAFASHEALATLRSCYADETVWMTYGSYEPFPASSTCPMPSSYPVECVKSNDYRNGYKWGILFNHLRTLKYHLFDSIDRSEFVDRAGNVFKCAGDTAVMLPALELAGGRYQFVKSVLYRYTSDSPLADWRTKAKVIDANHSLIFSRVKRQPLKPVIVRSENYV